MTSTDPAGRGARSTGVAATVLGIIIAVLSVAALLAIVRIALGTTPGQQWDDSAMGTVYAGRDTQIAVLSVLGRVSIGLVLVVMAGCVLMALLRGRLQWAVGAVAVIAGANISTQLLKHVILERPDLGLGTLNSLPSGHTTVVASATAATLLVSPPALRPLLVLGGAAATTLTGASTIVAGWHRPFDIVAALAVSLFWAALVSALVSRRIVAPRGSVVAAAAGSAGGLVALVGLGVRPVMGWDGFVEAAAVLGIIAAATAVFTVVAALLAFDDPVPRETSDPYDDSAVGVAGAPLSTDRPRA